MSRPIIYDAHGRRATHAPGGYLGAGFSQRRSWLPGLVTDSRREYTAGARTELLRRARFMKKNVGLVRGIAKSLVDHAIGPGVFPMPATSDDAWNERSWKYMWELAKIADVSRRMTLWEAQRAKADAKFYEGEIFTAHLGLEWPQFQLIRSHNCGSFDVNEGEGWCDGVKLDAFNRPLAYRFRLAGEDRYATVKAASVVHSYMPEDTDDVRGKTALVHAITHLNDILDLLTLEMTAVKDNSLVARVIQTESGEDEDDEFAQRFRGGRSAAVDIPESALLHRWEEVFGGEVKYLKANESMKSFASARPSPTFTGFIDWCGKLVTNGCGFPYEFAWNPNDLKGPGVRFILEKVRLAVEAWRRDEIADTYAFYTYAVARAMETGELPRHPEWNQCEWIGGAPDVTIDKGRDGAQDRDNIKAALTTFKRHFASQGLWWKTELRQKAKEAAFIAELAEEYEIDPDRIHLLLQHAAAQPAARATSAQPKTDPADDDTGEALDDAA